MNSIDNFIHDRSQNKFKAMNGSGH